MEKCYIVRSFGAGFQRGMKIFQSYGEAVKAIEKDYESHAKHGGYTPLIWSFKNSVATMQTKHNPCANVYQYRWSVKIEDDML